MQVNEGVNLSVNGHLSVCISPCDRLEIPHFIKASTTLNQTGGLENGWMDTCLYELYSCDIQCLQTAFPLELSLLTSDIALKIISLSLKTKI